MANMKVFMLIDGIEGSSRDADHEGWCDLRGFHHEMQYPFDMREGEGRGEPQHGRCTIIKAIDKASPLLYEKLCKKQSLPNIKIEFWRDNPDGGGSECYFTIELLDCRVVYAKPYMPKPIESDETTPPHMEEIGYAYRIINWTWLSGGQIPTTFDFSNPNA